MDIREQFDRCWAGTRFLLLGETEEAFPILEEKIFHRFLRGGYAPTFAPQKGVTIFLFAHLLS